MYVIHKDRMHVFVVAFLSNIIFVHTVRDVLTVYCDFANIKFSTEKKRATSLPEFVSNYIVTI